jgi:hypothetical protein
MSTAMQECNQHTPDYELGFASGVIYAHLTRDRMLREAEQFFVAYAYFARESKSGVLVCEDFVKGWQDGYRAYFDGIV